jgi:inner membrane protein
MNKVYNLKNPLLGMNFKTHLAIGGALALAFLPAVNNKWVFFPLVLIASIFPDVDTGFSTIGANKMFRPLQWFVNHRGLIHSFTICVLFSVFLAFVWGPLGLPVFLGYSFHLLADSFTVEGIEPFWPFGKRIEGTIKVNGIMEQPIFFVFLIIDALLLIRIFM